MVLTKLLACIALMATAACNQSLFEHGSTAGDDTSPGDGGADSSVPATCQAPCVADAAADFDGTATGSTHRWRYLDDTRQRAWTPMVAGTPMAGTEANAITTCAAKGSAAACAHLPGALLVTSSGASSTADPAIEITAPANKVLQLAIRVHVPAGGKPQEVRLYRAAREDRLFTGTAMPGTTLDAAITVDAFAGDRFLLALAPTAMGTADVGVQMFVSETGEAFPRNCQLGLTFEPPTAIGSSLRNECNTTPVTSWNDQPATEVMVPPAFAAGPFPESGMAGDFIEGKRLDTQVVADRTGDHTAQFWFKLDQYVASSAAVVLSDMDLDDGDPGGVAMDVFEFGGVNSFEALTCTSGTPTEYTQGKSDYPAVNEWHFIRVVQRGDTMTGCIDGVKKFEAAVPAGSAVSSYPLRIGRNSVWQPQASYLDGQVDDLRFFKGVALPCE